eukprot:1678069-Prymnesium_polylepis.1
MERIGDRIRTGANRTLSAADFSVMVVNVPYNWSSGKVRTHFERFGEVVHVGLSLDNGKLIRAMRESQRLRNAHTDAL